jgi:DNA-binding response OmpR family regulator
VQILLVEDHRDTRLALAKLLTRFGHDVAPAENVHEALTLLDTVAFDALLSDIGLPDGDGLALVQEAKRRQNFRTTIAITALASTDDRERGLQAGFDHYLTKPLEVSRLRSVLHHTV